MRKYCMMIASVVLMSFFVLSSAIAQVQPDSLAEEEGQLDEFRTEMQSDLDRFEQEFMDIETQIQTADPTVQGEMNQTLMDLRQRRDSLIADTEALEGLDDATYEQRRTELSQRFDELEVDLGTARLNAIQAREDFQGALQTRFDEFDQQLDELDERIQGLDEATRVQYSEQLTALRNEREALTVRSAEVEAATDDDFGQLRGDVADEIATFETNLRQFTRTLDQGMDQGMTPGMDHDMDQDVDPGQDQDLDQDIEPGQDQGQDQDQGQE